MNKTTSLKNVDIINKKLDQLRALLCVGMCDDFSSHSTKIQSDYMWACSSLADEIATAFRDGFLEVEA